MSAYLNTRELDSELDELQSRFDEEGLEEDETDRLNALVALRDEIGSEWRHGVTLIPEDEFEDYAREFAEDCFVGGGDKNPLLNYVDWSKWADDVKMDYSSVDFDGNEYWYRS